VLPSQSPVQYGTITAQVVNTAILYRYY